MEKEKQVCGHEQYLNHLLGMYDSIICYPLPVCNVPSLPPPFVSAFPSVPQLRKLEEALEASNQELEKSKEVLKTNENGEGATGNTDCVSLIDTEVHHSQTYSKHSV